MTFEEFSKLAKVGIDLNSCQSLLSKLKAKMKFREAKSSFDFLNKLISSSVISPRSKPPNYETLIDAITELENKGFSEAEHEAAAKILEKFGIQLQESNSMQITPEEFLDATPAGKFEKDSAKMDTAKPSIVSYAIICKFNIDHLRGMAWPDIWYNEFSGKTKQFFGKEMTEISAGNSNDLTKKVEEIISTNNLQKVYIIIFGFSPCISAIDPFIPGHIIIPVDGQLPEIYNVENIGLIKQLENIKTFLILFTLPSTKLQLRNERDFFQAYKFDAMCRIQSKALFLQCPVSYTDIWEEITQRFYEILEDKDYFSRRENYIYLNNLTSPVSDSTMETDSALPKTNISQEGLACNLVFGEFTPVMNGMNGSFKKRFTGCRNWKYLEDGFPIKHKNTMPKDDSELQDIADNINLEISEGVKYLLIFIYQSIRWELKQNSINAYINIVNTISEAIKQDGVKKIFMNFNSKDINNWTFDKEDARQLERGIRYTKGAYFILSDGSFLLQFSHLLRFQESTKQYYHFLKPTVEKTIKQNDSKGRENKNFSFAQVVSSPETEDFIFPPATIDIK